VEPPQTQNSSEFIQQLIFQILRNPQKGALVVEQGGKLYVADDFNKTPYAMYEDIFTQVTVKNFTFNKSFAQGDVLYFKLCDSDIKQVIDGLYASYSKLIAYSMKSFQRSRGLKAKFSYKAIPPAGSEQRKAFDSLVNEKFKQFLEADGAVIPMGEGQDFTELTQRTYASETSRDIRAMIDDIFDFTAKAYGIHPALLRGDVQQIGDALDYTLTFCVDPFVDMIQEEINRKRNGYADFVAGTYLQIDTRTIKHIDLLSVSSNIDKLISSGVFCVNDVLKILGLPEIDEPWAKQHFVTRNYQPFEEALKSLSEGGGSG
jgi:HK97 family phage portal protein